MKRSLLVIGLILLLVAMSCAPGTNRLTNIPRSNGTTAGFFLGVWHGFTLLFTLVASLFIKSIRIYEVHNCGHLYNIGFVLGVMLFFGGSGGGMSCRSRRHKHK
ncbi:MAG: hypothetical protein GY835_13740 [bacterium]|nr:hypothetical protein [bacterium]